MIWQAWFVLCFVLVVVANLTQLIRAIRRQRRTFMYALLRGPPCTKPVAQLTEAQKRERYEASWEQTNEDSAALGEFTL